MKESHSQRLQAAVDAGKDRKRGQGNVSLFKTGNGSLFKTGRKVLCSCLNKEWQRHLVTLNIAE